MLSEEIKMSEMLASDLFAVSQGSGNFGRFQCYWCTARCDETWRHNEPPPIPYQRSKSLAKCPANHWICAGCWLWRRPRVTVTFLDNSYKDGQTASNYSWWVTDIEAKAIIPSCKHLLHSELLKPPNRFVLNLSDGTIPTFINLAVVNDISIIEANTPLMFTMNNVVSEYTVYDLDTALKDKDASRTPGVRTLINYFSPWTVEQVDKRRPVGKPREIQVTDNVKKIIQLSGKPVP